MHPPIYNTNPIQQWPGWTIGEPPTIDYRMTLILSVKTTDGYLLFGDSRVKRSFRHVAPHIYERKKVFKIAPNLVFGVSGQFFLDKKDRLLLFVDDMKEYFGSKLVETIEEHTTYIEKRLRFYFKRETDHPCTLFVGGNNPSVIWIEKSWHQPMPDIVVSSGIANDLLTQFKRANQSMLSVDAAMDRARSIYRQMASSEQSIGGKVHAYLVRADLIKSLGVVVKL